MSLIGRGLNWLRSIAARRRLEREMLEEMAEHVEQAAERFRARGMSEHDALVAARREFGKPGVVQEEARDARGAQWIDGLAKDLRYALRHFARTPLTTVTIVLTLTLGIGVVASMFSVMDGVFNRPAPGVPNDPSLVMIRGIDISEGRPQPTNMSWPQVTEYAALTDRFGAVAASTSQTVILSYDGTEGVGTATVQFVSANWFSTLGLRLATGPGFVRTGLSDLAEPELTAIASQTFAAERLGGVANAVGKEVRVNDVTVRIVGVAPRRFNGATRLKNPRALWLPLSSYPLVMGSSGQVFASRDSSRFGVVARLQPGVSTETASAAVHVIASRVDANPGSTTRVPVRGEVALLRGWMYLGGISREDVGVTAMLGALVLLILLVCTTTVSSLLVGAAVSRRHEIGVRLALGASRVRIVRQLLTETTILALGGGALGLLAFGWVCRLIAATLIDVDVTPNWATAVFTVGFAVVTALLCGLSPALHSTRSGVAGVLKDGASGATSRTRLQRTFVVAQIALTQPLLVGLAMMIAVTMRGFGPAPGSAIGDRLVLAYFDTRAALLANAPDPVPDVVRRIASLPGVTSVLPQRTGYRALMLQLTTSGSTSAAAVRVYSAGVPPTYFRTLEVPIMLGREFTAADLSPDAPGRIILGSDAATHFFGRGSPIGQRFYQLSREGQREGELEVVGVVPSEQLGPTDDEDRLRVFVPLASERFDAVMIRTTAPAEPLIPTLRALVRAEAPRLPITAMETLAQADRDRRKEVLQSSGAVAAAGLVALFLGAIGLYAVVAIAVGQRRREIGVRVAVGATPRQVVVMFFSSGLRLSILGLLIGLPLSAAALRILAVEVRMPLTSIPAIALVIGAVVVAVAALATWLPARRAAGVDPLVALRAE